MYFSDTFFTTIVYDHCNRCGRPALVFDLPHAGANAKRRIVPSLCRSTPGRPRRSTCTACYLRLCPTRFPKEFQPATHPGRQETGNAPPAALDNGSGPGNARPFGYPRREPQSRERDGSGSSTLASFGRVFTVTRRMVGRCTALRLAFASAASFLCRFTIGFTSTGGINRASWPSFRISWTPPPAPPPPERRAPAPATTPPAPASQHQWGALPPLRQRHRGAASAAPAAPARA